MKRLLAFVTCVLDIQKIIMYDDLIKSPMMTKLNYIELFAATCGRVIKHIRKYHFVLLAVEDPKAAFDFKKHNLDRMELVSANSYEVNVKNVIGAINADEEKWVVEHMKENQNRLPDNRPDGAEIISIKMPGKTMMLEEIMEKVSDFLDNWHIPKNRNNRGAEENGIMYLCVHTLEQDVFENVFYVQA